jgi:hypothetical protein
LSLLRVLTTLPDFANREELQDWLTTVLTWGVDLAGKTDTEIDDKIAGFFLNAVQNEKMFAALHELILMFIGDEGTEKVMLAPELAAEAERCKVSPTVIIAIIQAAIALLKEFGVIKAN